jgi:hypothetical protein
VENLDHFRLCNPIAKKMSLQSFEKERILAFVNRAQRVEDLTEPALLKDADGQGYTIGREVARRILDIRETLPLQRFLGFEQLDAVPGVGRDKLADLAASVAPPAAETFRERMFAQLLGENWSLTPHTTFFDDRRSFFDLVQSNSRFTEWTGGQVEQLALQTVDNQTFGNLVRQLLEKCPLECWDNSHYGAIAFAFWFYRFDADNWFTLERVREETERYLTYYQKHQHRLELRFFKSFPNSRVLVDAISPPDLPVVVNYGEQEVTIWTCALRD